MQVGNSERAEGYPSTWRDGGADRTCRAPGGGELAGCLGPLPRSAPSSRAAFREFLRPRRVLASEVQRRFGPGLSKSRPFPCRRPWPPSLLPCPLQTRSLERKGDGAGGAAETSPRRPCQKAQHCPVPAGQACPREQRGTLFSAVVSWPFDLSAAGEMLLLTFG